MTRIPLKSDVINFSSYEKAHEQVTNAINDNRANFVRGSIVEINIVSWSESTRNQIVAELVEAGWNVNFTYKSLFIS